MTVRIGLIGAGGIAGAHINGYLAVPDEAAVTAVADVDAEHAAARAELAGGAHVFADYRDLIASGDVDAVDICLPHHLHADAIVAAAEAGKHVLCEKPLCLTVAESERIRAAIAASGVTFMAAHNQLCLRAVGAAKRLLDEGAIGDVYELRTTDSFYNKFDPSSMGWRANRATSGGGELIDTGYHPTYLLLHLAGGRPVEVSAMLSTHRLTFADGEDSARVLVRFDNGVVGEIVTSWAYQPPAETEKFSVVGSEGSLWSDVKTLRRQRRGGTVTVSEFPAFNSHVDCMRDFVRCVADGTRPQNTADEATDVLKVILGAYRSAEERRVVTLADL
jgi:predicted dehydrogenase